MDDDDYPPLLSYLEALPSSHKINEEVIIKNLCGAGSLFQSPSATASAFMYTGNEKCLSYLQSLAQRCPNGGEKEIRFFSFLRIINHYTI